MVRGPSDYICWRSESQSGSRNFSEDIYVADCIKSVLFAMWRFFAVPALLVCICCMCSCSVDMQIKSKFWGKSLEVQPVGLVHLRLPT